MQAHEQCSEPHNILTKDDIRALYTHGLSKATPLGFLNRMIFKFAILTTWKPGMLYNLDVSQATLMKEKSEDVYNIHTRIALSDSKKAAQGGLWAVNDKPL